MWGFLLTYIYPVGNRQRIMPIANWSMLKNEKKQLHLFQTKEKKGFCCQWHFPDSATEPDKNDWFPRVLTSFIFKLCFVFVLFLFLFLFFNSYEGIVILGRSGFNFNHKHSKLSAGNELKVREILKIFQWVTNTLAFEKCSDKFP